MPGSSNGKLWFVSETLRLQVKVMNRCFLRDTCAVCMLWDMCGTLRIRTRNKTSVLRAQTCTNPCELEGSTPSKEGPRILRVRLLFAYPDAHGPSYGGVWGLKSLGF